MLKTILWWAATLLISNFTEKKLTSENIQRVKDFIVDQADHAIDNTIKHERAATLIKSLAEGLSDTVVDWVIRTLLWASRWLGDIKPAEAS